MFICETCGNPREDEDKGKICPHCRDILVDENRADLQSEILAKKQAEDNAAEDRAYAPVEQHIIQKKVFDGPVIFAIGLVVVAGVAWLVLS